MRVKGKGSGVNIPDGLIGHDDLAPVLDLIRHSLQLARNNTHRLITLPLLQAFSTAKNNAQSTVKSSLGLAGDEIVRLLQNNAALRVPEDRPCDTTLFELVNGDLAGEGTVRLVEDVLRGYFKAGAEVLAREEEVEGGGCDDDL
jgi:hypothetical protein